MDKNERPLPWKANGSEMNMATWVEDANGKRICTMVKGEADWHCAQQIERAVNTNGDLLRALEAAIELMEQEDFATLSLVPKLRAARDRARAST